MSSEGATQKVVIVGAGPVGALAALYAANRGDHVEIYELRSDLREESTTPLNFTKSINLALSERGINSMRHAGSPGLLEEVLAETIPMHGRMIHSRKKTGELEEASQQYDSIHAVDRAGLNKRLLDALDVLPNVTFFFNHKLTGADFKHRKAWFEKREGNPRLGSTDAKRAPEIEVNFDFLIGADGAHSAARYHLMKFARLDYKQEYIDTLWCEFQIAPVNGTFAMSPNHLHIWPGQDFMFIAIPSLDRSFTCTLFAPAHTFEDLSKEPGDLPAFFDTNFPGVSPEHIDADELVRQFTHNPHLPLINIKCSPHHYGSSTVILGDAAHAMVPFYGQGMNAGLEDVRVLFELLDKHDVYNTKLQDSLEDRAERRRKALDAYTQYRVPDASAINDLALRNYYEMRAGVTSTAYLARKSVEEALSKYFPSLGWSTQYSRVSFGNERYSHVVAAVQRQSRALVGTAVGLLFLVGLSGSVGVWYFLRRRAPPKPNPSLLWRYLDLMKDALYSPLGR